MEPLTLAEMREEILHNCFRLTQLDVRMPSPKLGYPAPNNPNPSVRVLNMAIRHSISDINSEIEFAETADPISIAIAAQTADGVYYYDLSTAQARCSAYSITFITQAVYTPTSTGVPKVLTPTTLQALARDEPTYPARDAGSPEHYLMSGYQMGMWPGPSLAGTLTLSVGLSLHTPVADNETIGFLPGDKYVPFLDVATARVCAMMPEDLAMKARLQVYAPLGQAGVQRLSHWLGSFLQEHQPRTTFESHRVFVGRSR